MESKFTDYLYCPACHGRLQLSDEERTGDEIKYGKLYCCGCGKNFEIKDGLADLKFPEKSSGADLQSEEWHNRRAEYYNPRRWLFYLGLWDLAICDTRARAQLISRLRLNKGFAVFESAVGTGNNLPIIARQIGKTGRLYGLDISSGMLRIAQKTIKKRNISAGLVIGNGSYLPYRDNEFNAVLQLGALNQIQDKRRSIEEMVRVAKEGARIVICDEGLEPGREKTFLGRRILRINGERFNVRPPDELIPRDIRDYKVYWIWHGTFWVIELRK